MEGAARGRIDDALFAPLVVEAANQGDQVACGILSEAGQRIGENAVHVLRTLGMENMAFEVVLAGGMFLYGGRLFAGGVESVVRRVAPNAHFVLLEAPPVVGAVLIALDLAGEQPRPGMRETLARATVSALGLPAASALNQLRTA